METEQNIIFKQLSGEKLSKICKDNKITVNSLIYAAYFISNFLIIYF